MEGLFWGCLIGGVIFAVVSVILGDVISNALDGALDFLSLDGYPWIEPMTIVGAITAFGGAGLLLTEYAGLGAGATVILALLIAFLLGAGVFFLYVKPMKNSENSTAYSVNDFAGALAEVITPIPEKGYGEVLVRAGAGYSNQIAGSFDGRPIPGGSRVVVVEVKDSTLYVSAMDEP